MRKILVATIITLSTMFLWSGCTTPGYLTSDLVRPTTQIITDPPGARIDVDKYYIGDSPITYTWPVDRYHFYSLPRDCVRFNNSDHTIEATLSGISQTKNFNGGFPGGSEDFNDTIPTKVIFDLQPLGRTTSLSTASDYVHPKTEFITDPPGVKIEIDSNYIGNSPITYTWPGDRRHYYALTNDCPKFCDSSHIIKAIPVNTGQYVQTKYFSGGFSQGSETMNTPVPAKVFFDMHLKSLPAEFDINIQ